MSRGPRTCAVCGVLFAGTVRALYCSQRCAQRAYHQRHAAQHRAYSRQWQQTHPHPRPQHPPRACATCGTVFTPKNINNRYCSAPCQRRADRQRRPPRPRLVTRRWEPP